MKKIVIVVGFLLSGCASWFLNGAKMAERDYAKDQPGGFKIQKCVSLADNTPLNAPDATYHLVTEMAAIKG
jgi:hypothetical protein